MQITGNKLVADDGKTLTNGVSFGKTIYLANGTDSSDWREVADEEAAVLRRDAEEAQAEDYETALNGLGVSFDAE